LFPGRFLDLGLTWRKGKRGIAAQAVLIEEVRSRTWWNSNTEDVVFLEMFKSAEFSDVSLNQWIRRLPHLMVEEHLHLDASEIERIPNAKDPVFAHSGAGLRSAH
jgi:oxalate decarboxylase/phosphoglucose isomerase-like protein (cupin superfamily)